MSQQRWIAPTVFLTLLGLATGAGAATGFAGRWASSDARVKEVSGQVTACTIAEFTMEEAPGELTIARYHAKCGSFETKWGPSRMRLDGERVTNGEGRQIGTLKNGVLITAEPDSGVIYDFNLKPTASGGLECLYGARNFVGSMSVQGTFAPAAR